MQRAPRGAALALITLAIALVAGCGTSTLSGASFESRLQSILGNIGGSESSPFNTGSSQLQVTAVKCPKSIPAKAGANFSCSVTAEGGLTGTVHVTLGDAKGKSLKYNAMLQGNGETQTLSGNSTATTSASSSG